MRRAAVVTILAILAVSAGGVAGVSAQATAGADAAAAKLRLRADAGGKIRYDKKRLQAAPGRVTIRLTNPGSSGKPHAIEIEGHGVEKQSAVAQPGDRVAVRARLSRGSYEFYCPVDGHRAAGMEGTLVVG
jgi:plastocyanin